MTGVDSAVGPLTREATDEVAAVLADAFADDPWAAYVTGPHRRALARLMRVPVAVAARRGGVLRHRDPDGTLAGAAAWTPATERGAGPADAWRSGTPALPLHLGPAGLTRLLRDEAAVDAVLDPLVTPGDAYLWVLGVRRDRHGRGLGRALVARVATDAAARGFGRLVLTTDNPANVAVYEAMGFSLLTAARRPSGLTAHVLARPTPGAPGPPVRTP